MITIRRAAERGHTVLDWLDTWHTFSFADYYDPRHMSYRSLRVINDDRIGPGGGFPKHPHRDMEIITVVLAGALEHQDSLGSVEVLRPGEVQRMSAGAGITHSEYNHSATESVHLLQIWITPQRTGLKPAYSQRRYDSRNQLRLVVAPDDRAGALAIHQDAFLYLGTLTAGTTVQHPLAPDRHAWVQVATGTIQLNGQTLTAGDGAAISGEIKLNILAATASEVLVFDLA